MLVPVLYSESDWGQITDKHQCKELCIVYIAINQLALALLLQIHNSHSLNIVKASWKSDRHHLTEASHRIKMQE